LQRELAPLEALRNQNPKFLLTMDFTPHARLVAESKYSNRLLVPHGQTKLILNKKFKPRKYFVSIGCGPGRFSKIYHVYQRNYTKGILE
jgi:hypothetical protein